MAQLLVKSDLELLCYANAVRARSRRGLGITAIATLFVVCAIVDAFASTPALSFSDWPSRSVRVIVPFPAGSADDLAARMYAEGLSGRWARPVTVENSPDGMTSGDAFAAARDDHVLLYGTAAMITVTPLLRAPRPHNPVLDLFPVAPATSSILVIAVTSGLQAHSLKDLVALVRAKPGKLSWGAGPSLPHFVFAATLKRHRLRMVHIFYPDAPTPQADLSEGRLHVLSSSLQAVAGSVAAGTARILAVTSPRREPMLPDIPTVAEAGFPELEIEDLAGLFGSRDMPPELRDRIAADMRAVAHDPLLQARLVESGQRVLVGTPSEFATAIGRQRIRIQQIMHSIDLKRTAQHVGRVQGIQRGHARNATRPPSIGSRIPVTQRDSSEAR